MVTFGFGVDDVRACVPDEPHAPINKLSSTIKHKETLRNETARALLNQATNIEIFPFKQNRFAILKSYTPLAIFERNSSAVFSDWLPPLNVLRRS